MDEEIEAESDLLATLYQYQHTGHLYDVTMASCGRVNGECEIGNYTIVMARNSNETKSFIKFAYTGQNAFAENCELAELDVHSKQ